MPAREIVGIVLVRNEDLHLERAVENVARFCDRILVADHGSTDGTPAVIATLAARHAHLTAQRIDHPRESHSLVQEFAGNDTWVFGVDGDEIYDPARLDGLRARLLAGEFDEWWMLLGNVLNCDLVDVEKKVAAGWLAPPCRSITKLYNFQRIRSWKGDTPERLHGGAPDFLPGCDATKRLHLHEQMKWDESPLRCLHTCFVPRSSRDEAGAPLRENIMELYRARPLARVRRWWQSLLGQPHASAWKPSRYRRGERVTIDASAFFP